MFQAYKIKLTMLRDTLGTNPCDPHILDVHILDKQRSLIAQKSKDTNTQINKYLDQLDISKGKSDEERNRLLDKLEELMGVELTAEERQAAIAGELESLKQTFKELDIKGTTVFLWDKKTKKPCIGDHMIYGFMKAAAEAIGRTLKGKRGEMLFSTTYTQSVINQHVRCTEQFIAFDTDIKRNEDGTPAYLQRSLRAKTAQGPRISLVKSEVVEAGATLEFTLKILKDSPLTEEVLKTLFDYGEFTGLGQWRNAGNGMFSTIIVKQ